MVEHGQGPRPVEDMAVEAERARTPWTPLRAFAGVWLAVAVVVAIVIAVIVIALTLFA